MAQKGYFMKIFYGWIAKFCSLSLLMMTILGALNAILRYSSKFFGQVWSSNAFLEGQWYLFSIMFLVGGGYTLWQNKHVRVDVLYGNFQSSTQSKINLVGLIFFLVPFCFLGLWSSWDFIVNSWQIKEVSPDVGGLPRYPIKMMIFVGFFLLLMEALHSIWRGVQEVKDA